MKRLFFAVALLLLGAHAHAQTSEAEIRADVLAIQIAAAVDAERFTDAAKLLEEYAGLGVTMPPPLILQRAVVYSKLKQFLDAEVQLKNYLKKSKRGSEKYNHALLMLKEVEPKAEAAAQQPGAKFKDCSDCPEMVTVRAGSFMMGSPTSEEGRDSDESPQHQVTVEKFAVGRHEVTFDEWEACRRAEGCSHDPKDRGWGKGKRPVIYVSWGDAKEYVEWLSKNTGKHYRLLSESEWEYAARAETTTPYHTDSTISSSQANYDGNHGKTVAVGSYPANYFGLHDMHGNVFEWVEDCWHDYYEEAPGDGSAWTADGKCGVRVLRGGSWSSNLKKVRSAFRFSDGSVVRGCEVGFRVARALTP